MEEQHSDAKLALLVLYHRNYLENLDARKTEPSIQSLILKVFENKR